MNPSKRAKNMVATAKKRNAGKERATRRSRRAAEDEDPVEEDVVEEQREVVQFRRKPVIEVLFNLK